MHCCVRVGYVHTTCLRVGGQLWDDECQRGRLTFHGMNGVFQYGESWVKFEMKVPTALIGFRIKARANRWPSYVSLEARCSILCAP